MIWVVALLLSGQVVGQPTPTALNRNTIHQTVESLASVVNREYFDERVGARIASGLRASLSGGRYDAHGSVESLAKALSRDLLEASHDKHLVVTVTQPSDSTTAPDVTREARARRENFGVRRVEILPGNIGYLDITWFYRLEEAREAITSAMQVLQNSDALILDLRGNGGGSPETVALLASYQFDAPSLPLFEIVPRSGDGRSYATLDPAVDGRNGRRPVYVLTSGRTFSAGEGFAFIMQERRRAEIIGEKTPGAANPGRPYPIGTLLSVTVPNGQVRGAVSGLNWEGSGVTPDINTKSADALRTAQMRALRELLKAAPLGAWRDSLKRHLETLEGGR